MLNNNFLFTISIVSHGQWKLISNLLNDFLLLSEENDFRNFEIIITFNIDENYDLLKFHSKLNIKIINNSFVKGFGSNHNSAFRISNSKYFIVVNPDIRLKNFDFVIFLLNYLTIIFGVMAPKVIDSSGNVQDNARKFPTITSLLLRQLQNNHSCYLPLSLCQHKVDWVAGMFMIFPSYVFKQVGGFDENFFLYFEDVDICKRINQIGYDVIINNQFFVIHDAQKLSKRNVKFFFIHLLSAFKFFIKFR